MSTLADPTGASTAPAATASESPPPVAPSGAAASPGDTGEAPPDPLAGEAPIVVLPAPILTDAFEIGAALYDPDRVPEAVVSMLALVNVDIVRTDAGPGRTDPGPAHGSRWLYDVEVQAMIDRTVDELDTAGDDGADGLPFTIGDIYDALAPALPGASKADVVLGYENAYARHPDALVPQLMLGQPIDGATHLSTAQVWLLLLDGFVGPAAPTGDTVTATLAVAGRGGPAWGTAIALTPLLGNFSPMTEEEMRQLIVHLPLLLACIGWQLDSAIVHEGHGRPGSPVTLVGGPEWARPVVSATTHRPLIESINQGFGDPAAIVFTWTTGDAGVFAQHGAFDQQLPAQSLLGPDRFTRLTYTPRQELANGAGTAFRDTANLELKAPAADLIRAYYRLPNPHLAAMLEAAIVETVEGATAGPQEPVDIGWHEHGLAVRITNEVDVDVEAGVGFDGHMRRKGDDTLSGSLSRRADGSYVGVLTAEIDRLVKMDLTLPLAAGGCDGRTRTKQAVYVVAKRVPSVIHGATDELEDGSFSKDDVLLTLYPIAAPTAAPVWCEEMLPWTGVRTIDGRRVRRALIPLNDLRWTTPGRLRVHLPEVHDHLEYRDASDAGVLRGFNSAWTFTVDRGD